VVKKFWQKTTSQGRIRREKFNATPARREPIPSVLNDPFCYTPLLTIEWFILQRRRQWRLPTHAFEWAGRSPKLPLHMVPWAHISRLPNGISILHDSRTWTTHTHIDRPTRRQADHATASVAIGPYRQLSLRCGLIILEFMTLTLSKQNSLVDVIFFVHICNVGLFVYLFLFN